jgi:hypothetical protein
MLRSEYDDEHDQVHIGDGSGQVISLSSEQALTLLRWLSHLFSQCQGCNQMISPESLQVLTYMREFAPFRTQTAWLCPDCYRDMIATSVDISN